MFPGAYLRVVRPLFRTWVLGVFVSGGAFLAVANVAASYAGRSRPIELANDFGQGLVFASVMVFLLEAAVFGLIRRAAAARLSRLESQTTRVA
ncbi:MAG: hypothetical protein HYT80_00560 [Euryarchaeota archaeon]|nr:hypothetical protein [Euryarchaeota archaeon]